MKAHLTNILFEQQIPAFRETVVRLGREFEEIWLLFDNIDKGWPARRVEEHDVRTVRHLIGVLDRIQRDLGRKETSFKYLLFLRSDVYEKLVEETSDRGKYNPIKVDWSDEAQLRYLLEQRVKSNFDNEEALGAWTALNPRLADGSEAVTAMIDASLMRPRFLIDLAERALSFAVNRGHAAVEATDVENALEKHSMYLVTDFGYEVRDVSGLAETIFYQFIGEGTRLSENQVVEIVNRKEHVLPVREIVSLLMWYGFLGIHNPNGDPIYIYDRDYDLSRLEAERDRLGEQGEYCINPAFLRGLV
jgi:hypothetical protein